MILVLERLVPQALLERLVAALQQGEFVAGSISAGAEAARVKHNLQLVPSSSLATTAAQQVLRLLGANHQLLRFARPRSITPPLFCRYDVGMAYGPHLDEPLMGKRPVRTDLSVTVFLSSPESYSGGALRLWTGDGVRELRGPAGSAVVYPSGCRHEVAEVTRGQRLVAVSWVESVIPDATQRELLFELSSAIDSLGAAPPDAADADGPSPQDASLSGSESPQQRLLRCRDALVRMWART